MDQSLHEDEERLVDKNNGEVRYLTLVVKDEKVFMVHRDVLLKASPFFEKLLESTTKRIEGEAIHLKMLTATDMEIILKFIYNGRAHFNTEEDAKNVITAAEQLLLLSLKESATHFLQQKLSISNCIATYYFAQEKRCEELTEASKNFIHLNFEKAAQSKDFLSLSSQEVQRWISSNDLAINAEVNVLNIIIRWIEHNKIERAEKFEELFGYVQLFFIPRDVLSRFVAKNSYVKQNLDCLGLVNKAVKWLDQADDCDFPWQQLPRRSLEAPAIIVYRQNKILCFAPGEDRWRNLPELKYEPVHLVSLQGKVFAFSSELDKCERYEPLLNKWTPLTMTGSSDRPTMAASPHKENIMQVLVVKGEIYAVEDRPKAVLWKYTLNFHSWNLIPGFDWGDKDQVCLVGAENFLYAIGGRKWGSLNKGSPKFLFLSDVERFNTEGNGWEKVTDIQQARRLAFGTAVQTAVYIAGGIGSTGEVLQTCEVYSTLTDEWQFIASLTCSRMFGSMVFAADRIFVLGGSLDPSSFQDEIYAVECYDSENNEWKKRATIPLEKLTDSKAFITLKGCPTQLLKHVINSLPSAESSLTDKSFSRSRICVIT